MQLSPNQKIFAQFLSVFPKSPQNLKYFGKNDEPQRLFLSKSILCKNWGYLNAQKALCQNTYGQ